MKKIFFTLLASLLLTPYLVMAQSSGTEPTINDQGAVRLPNPLGSDVTNIPQLANRLIIGILGIVGVISLLAFIWGGLLWMTSAGNADRVKQGRETLVYAVLGLLVIFISYTVINFVFSSLTH